MSTTYSSCVLASNFSVSKINLTPGQSFPASDPKTRLAGGFSALSPGTTFPLSPTLQLNADLTSLSDDQLETLAKSELHRANTINVKSYIVDPSMHVCVLADNGEKLEAFLDTFGGLLEIEPLLIGASHLEHDQISEVRVEKAEQLYEITATLRDPINMEACTYCGACGPACPEKCISPTLRIEYKDCSFCRECEKVCPHGAVDIYGVKRKTIKAPAIVLLGEVKVELPEDLSNVYTEQSLKDYFSTLFSTQVEEVVRCNSDICHYSTRIDAGCSRCMQACPAGAISQTKKKGVVVDYQICDECGSCSSVCPTGAMEFGRFTDETFVDYFKQFSLPTNSTVIIGDEQSLHSHWWMEKDQDKKECIYLEHPKIGALSLFHFLHLVSNGAGRILLVEDEKGSSLSFIEHIQQMNLILKDVTGLENVIERTTLAGISDTVLSSKEHSKALPGKNDLVSDEFVSRRKSIADALQFFSSVAEEEITLTAGVHGPFGSVSCDPEKCTQCFACLNECTIRSLKAGENAMSLTHTSSLCVGCGLCVTVCPEDALVLTNTVVLDEQYFSELTVAKAEPIICADCGKEFGTKKSFEKVMAVLKSKGMDKGHLECCEDCRVKKMFETA